MKKIVWTYGLISGTLITGFMVTSMALTNCEESLENASSMIVGFTAMFVAFAFIFVGLHKYRKLQEGQMLSFGKGLSMAMLMVAIASTMYVAGWVIEYKLFMPDFGEKYMQAELKNLEAKHLDPALYQTKVAEIEAMHELYKTPLGLVGMTYMEILTMGIPVAFIAALVMMRRKPKA